MEPEWGCVGKCCAILCWDCCFHTAKHSVPLLSTVMLAALGVSFAKIDRTFILWAADVPEWLAFLLPPQYSDSPDVLQGCLCSVALYAVKSTHTLCGGFFLNPGPFTGSDLYSTAQWIAVLAQLGHQWMTQLFLLKLTWMLMYHETMRSSLRILYHFTFSFSQKFLLCFIQSLESPELLENI